MAAHDFSDAPPDTISHYRAAQSFFYAEAKATLRQLIGAKKNCEMGTRTALSGTIYGVKLSTPHQPRAARKLQAPRLIRA